jgi:hypothetical protein
MILGILSDTHGNAARTATAARLLLSHDVETVIHCGDIGGETVLTELLTAFDPLDIPVYCVEGNVDHGDIAIRNFPANTTVMLLGTFGELTLAGKRMAIAHGDDLIRFQIAVRCNEYDYVFTGHTHERNDRREGKTRIINPGAVYRAQEPGVAVLDTLRDELEYLPLSDA